jgi:hypothetical protein
MPTTGTDLDFFWYRGFVINISVINRRALELGFSFLYTKSKGPTNDQK